MTSREDIGIIIDGSVPLDVVKEVFDGLEALWDSVPRREALARTNEFLTGYPGVEIELEPFLEYFGPQGGPMSLGMTGKGAPRCGPANRGEDGPGGPSGNTAGSPWAPGSPSETPGGLSGPPHPPSGP